MGIFLAITAAVFNGLASFFMKKSYKEFTPAVSLLFFSLFTVVFWSLTGTGFGINTSDLPKALAIGLIGATFAQGMYIFVLSKGELSITGTILASYSVYTVLGSMIFLGEKPNLLQIVFIITNILGVIIVTIPHKINKNDLLNYKYIAWPILGAISIGLSDTLSKGAINSLDLGTYLFGLAWAHIPVALVAILLSKEYKKLRITFQDYKFALTGSLLLSLGTLALYVSFNYGDASILAPITSSYPVLIVVLSVVFLKERLSKKDMIGLITVFAGILGLSLA